MEVFKEKVEAEKLPEPQQTPINPEEPKELQEKSTNDTIEIWEKEHNTKVVLDYFGTNIIGDNFLVKMPMGEINKFILEQMEQEGQEKTTKNFKEYLQGIEEQIGSSKLELFKRLHKLTGYIRVMRKLYKAQSLKDAYLTHRSEG
jgi:hypothetical protein